MVFDLSIVEVALEMGVFERVVVGQRHLANMVVVDERFFGLGLR